MNATTRSKVLGLLTALVAGLGLSATASAQQECHCDCYFSFDCAAGATCDYGSSFTVEDECWWRTPKPESVPGAGCTDDWGAWGQCDGRCVGPAAASHMLKGESIGAVSLGLTTWAAALTDVAMKGGGVPTAWRDRIDAIEFENPEVRNVLWRFTNDLMILARGSDFMIQPKKESFSLWEVAVDDLRNEPARRRNGEIVVAAVLAELKAPGMGRTAIEAIDVEALDQELMSRVCTGNDLRACVYQRVVDLGVLLRSGTTENGRGAASSVVGGPPTCPGCVGDIDATDTIDFGDLLELLANWGETSYPVADLDLSGAVDFGDLLMLLAAWGSCTP